MKDGPVLETPTAQEEVAAKGYEDPKRSRGVLEVVVTVDKIEAARLTEKPNEDMRSNYKLNVAMSEKQRKSASLVLGFTLDLTQVPQAAKITVTGTAELTGTEEEIKERIVSKAENTPPPVVEIIYERLYGLIYLVAGGIKAPKPLPNLLRKG